VDDLDDAVGARWAIGGDDAVALDAAMDVIQMKLADVSEAINDELFGGRR
jgi:hypothetical protein